jgi:phosphatidylglycerophosphatase A
LKEEIILPRSQKKGKQPSRKKHKIKMFVSPTFLRNIVTFFQIGYCPFAPGTMASVVALMLGCVSLSLLGKIGFVILFCLILFLAGYACFLELKMRPFLKDPGDYVIDEVLGQWCVMIATVFFLYDMFWLHVIGFVLFRFFDIYKPWPVSWVNDLDRFQSPYVRSLSVLLDDLVAAFLAFLVLVLIAFFFIDFL